MHHHSSHNRKRSRNGVSISTRLRCFSSFTNQFFFSDKVNTHEQLAKFKKLSTPNSTIYLKTGEVIGELIGYRHPTKNIPEIIFIVQLPRPDQEDIDEDSTNVHDITFSKMNEVAPKWTEAFLKAYASNKSFNKVLIKTEYPAYLLTRS